MSETDRALDPEETLQRWAAAEQTGDAEAMADLLVDDFTGVGPLGFTLTKQDWLQRHRDHALSYSRFELSEVTVQRYAGCAVVVARQDVDGTWQGHPVPGALRTAVVLVPAPDRWQLALVATSFVAGTPGAPPVPGRA
jgi:ketosteroid isomerase-like protein